MTSSSRLAKKNRLVQVIPISVTIRSLRHTAPVLGVTNVQVPVAKIAVPDEPGLSVARIRSARLNIRIRIAKASSISITDGVETVRASSSFSDRKLGDMRAALRTDLEEFSKKVARLDQSAENAVKALLLLKKRGRLILNDLFGSDDEKMRKAEELCRRACPNWKVPGWNPNSLAPGMVEVATDVGDGVPVEILPLFEFMDPEPEMEADEHISRLAGSFLGFFCHRKATAWAKSAKIPFSRQSTWATHKALSQPARRGGPPGRGLFPKGAV